MDITGFNQKKKSYAKPVFYALDYKIGIMQSSKFIVGAPVDGIQSDPLEDELAW